MERFVTLSDPVITKNAVVYVWGNPWIDFGWPQFIDKNKLPDMKQIQLAENGDLITNLMQKVGTENQYIFSGVGTDISWDSLSLTAAGIFHIGQDSLGKKSDSNQKIIPGSEAIRDIAPEKIRDFIETLKIPSISQDITVVTWRRLTPQEVSIIQSVWVVKQYIKVMKITFDGETSWHTLKTTKVSDITNQ
jgi:hypothetical protein